jgi:L,D-peptidoglycan transpeptidase YkuD (ErfK/YbiS/YcfS/YnhG family)
VEEKIGEKILMGSVFSLSLVLQMIVVVSSDWDAKEGILYRFVRNSLDRWELVSSSIAVTLGENGMAWGRGLLDLSGEKGVHKKEGDNKSPAGLFSLGPTFGYQRHAKKMPFISITDDLECVDDPNSEYYNQFVNKSSIANPDWGSSEKMKEIGALYAIGLVVHHNLSPIQPGKGSAIFMHVWRKPGGTTAGCTAMEHEHMQQIVEWLDSDQSPCLVQLPLKEYLNKQAAWGLPNLSLAK